MIERLEDAPIACDACLDTGWVETSCAGTHDVICGRRRAHLAHSFATVCPCRPLNRNFQDKLARSRRAA